ARLLMTVLAVMLGVAFVSGTLVFTSTISDAYRKSSEKGFTGVDVAIQIDRKEGGKAGPGAPKLTQGLLDRAASVPGVASVSASVAGSAAIADKHGELVGHGFSTQGGNYYAGKAGKDARYPLKDGRAPRTADEVALDSKTADRAGYKVGDTVRLSVDGPVLEQKVTGVFTTDDGNVAAGGSLALFDTATAQKLYAKPGEYSEILVKAQQGESQSALKAAIEKILPPGADAVTGKTLADDQAAAVEEGMGNMRTALLGFAAVALFVGVFIIANTFTMLVSQRTKEIALLRAVGASRRQVTRSVLVEALVVGAVAAVAGLVIGIGIGAALHPLMRSTGMLVPDGPLVVPPTAVFAALFVGVGVTVLAAWLPSRRAAKVPPVAAMGSLHAPASSRSLMLRNGIGSAVSAAGLLLSLTGALRDEPAKALLGLGAVLLLVGVIMLTPLLSRPLIAAAAPALRLFGISGKLARQNAVRNPRRTAATASALMIGLTLITSMTVLAVGMQRGLEKMATDGLRADYVLSMATHAPLSPEVRETVDRLPEVTATSPVRISPARIDGTSRNLTGVVGPNMKKLSGLKFSEGSFDRIGGDKVVVDHKTAKSFGWQAGSTFGVTYEDGSKGRLTVAGLFEGNNLLSGILVDTPELAKHQERVDDSLLMVKAKGGASTAVKGALTNALGKNPALRVQDKDDVTESISQTANLLLNMLYALLGMAVVVAVLGVVNTLALSVFERTKEIGMLGAIGLDRKGIKRMVRLESLVISLFGGVLGIALGLFLSWSAGSLIAERMETYGLVVPWDRLAVFLVLAVLVGEGAALWPARKAAKINSLEAIKAE
ncbi:ABC transporter permease, partial [Streptomyces cinnamoneus]|uniref:ABC transporter permease n=1 Tax=Streptomyces cinnamoneus TaxID=53446 RepID=UPI0037A73729